MDVVAGSSGQETTVRVNACDHGRVSEPIHSNHITAMCASRQTVPNFSPSLNLVGQTEKGYLFRRKARRFYFK